MHVQVGRYHHGLLRAECAAVVDDITADALLLDRVVVLYPICYNWILRDDAVHLSARHVVHVGLRRERVNDVFPKLHRDPERLDNLRLRRAYLRRLQKHLQRGHVIEKVPHEPVVGELERQAVTGFDLVLQDPEGRVQLHRLRYLYFRVFHLFEWLFA